MSSYIELTSPGRPCGSGGDGTGPRGEVEPCGARVGGGRYRAVGGDADRIAMKGEALRRNGEQRSWEHNADRWPEAKDDHDPAAYSQPATATASWQRSVLIIAALSALSWAAVILIVIAALSALKRATTRPGDWP